MPLRPSRRPLPSSSTASRAKAAPEEALRRYHTRAMSPHQCGAVHVQDVAAPLPLVWSLIRRFDRPQSYKCFVSSCSLQSGDGGVGSLREVRVASGLPAATSTERLDALDDDRHVISFSIVGGDHRLANYRSTTSLHEGEGGGGSGGDDTVVVESYVVDVPPGSTGEETRLFVDTIICCNLRSLARVTENIARSSSDGD